MKAKVKPNKLLNKTTLILFALLFAGIGTYLIVSSRAATPTEIANIWVASNGSDSGANCKRFTTPTSNPDSSGASLCKSFAAALSAANAGDIIRVLSGTTYGAQSLTRTGLSRDSNFDNNVQFIANGGPGSVTLAGLSIGSSSANSYGAVNLDGFHVTGGPAIQEAKDVRLSNFEANNQTYISNSQDIKLEKYIIQPSGFPSVTSAPFSNGWGIGIAQQGSGSGSAPSNITLDAINMHGVRATQPADHPDGIFMWRGGGVPTTTQWTGMKVRNSLFYNNECINWRYNDANPAQVEFENNFFDSSVNGISGCGYYSISVASATGIYRNNTIKGGIQVKEGDCPGTCGAKRSWKNNIILGGWSDQGCSNLASDTWSKNILDIGKCGANDISASETTIKFLGGSTYPDKFFLTSGSVLAIDAGDSSIGSYASTDYLGTARPQGAAPDIGAYEFRTATPTGSVAKVWVDTSGGTCARQDMASNYNDATACGSLQSAFNAASPGDTIRIVGGTYSTSQTVTGSKTSTNLVSIIVDSGSMNINGGLTVRASNVSITGPGTASNMDLGNGASTPASKNITIDGWIFDKKGSTGAAGYVSSIDTATIRNSTFMNNLNESMVFTDAGPGGGMQNVTWENNVFHDALTDAAGVAAAVHTECVYGGAGTSITFINNRFYKCRTMDLFVTTAKQDTLMPKNYTIENNIFECSIRPDGSCHDYGLVFVDGWNTLDGAKVRNNWFAQTISLPSTPTGSISYFYSNAVNGALDCTPSSSLVVRAYNVTTGSACSGPGNKQVSNLMNDANFKPISGSPLIDSGDPSNSTVVDKSGNARFGLPDAGAYEYLSSTLTTKPGDVNKDGKVDIDDLSILLTNWKKYYQPADFKVDSNNIVDIDDLSILLSNWTQS